MESQTYTGVKYEQFNGENVCITAFVGDKKLSIPLAETNRHYAEIMRQVEAGELTIQEADNGTE